MRVKIRSFFAVGVTDHLRPHFASGKDLIVEVEAGTDVEALLQKLPALGPPESFDDMMLHVFVNGRLQGFDCVLKPGDIIDLHIPVSGG